MAEYLEDDVDFKRMWHRIRVYLSFTLINACLSQAESKGERIGRCWEKKKRWKQRSDSCDRLKNDLNT